MTHGGAAHPAEAATGSRPEHPPRRGLRPGPWRLAAAIVAFAVAVFAITLLIARAGRPEPVPPAKAAVAELPPPAPVKQQSVTAALPALGKAPEIPDLRRTPEETGGGTTASGPSVPTPSTTPEAVTPQADPAPAPVTPPSSPPADSGSGGDDTFCNPC